MGTMRIEGIKPVICTQPNIRMRMTEARQKTGINGISLQEVDPRAGTAILRVSDTVGEDQRETYLRAMGIGYV